MRAEVAEAAGASGAVPAGDDRMRRDLVPHGEALHFPPDVRHHARTFVSEHDVGPGAAIRAALALALVAAGDLARAAEEVGAGVTGSYLDELQLDLAAAFLALGDVLARVLFEKQPARWALVELMTRDLKGEQE